MTTHTYRTSLTWSGSTSSYDGYDRRHELTVGPAALSASADPVFLGDPALPNPEQLLVAAASSCQLLSFLAVAAMSGLEVVGYRDDAEGEMSEEDRPMWVRRITLRPRITVRGATAERVERLVHKAHGQCFIANSLRSEIVLEPLVEVAA